MALQFQPPNLPMAYPENSIDKLNKTFELLNAYAEQRRQQTSQLQTQKLAQQQKDIEMAKGMAANGQDFMDAYNKIVAARTPTQQPQTAPFSTPRAPTALGGYLNPDSVNPAGNQQPTSPIIGHWNASMGGTAGVEPPQASTGTLPSPAPTTGVSTDPMIQEYQKDPIAFKKQHGPAGLGKLKTQAELDALIGKPTSTPYYSPKGEKKFDLPKDAKILPDKLDISTKQDQFDQKEWDKIVKETNPLTASSRSTLGMASKANFQADRALVTLSKPVVTNQEAGNVMADIAAIYQTGSPTQYGMSHQEYSTLYGKIQGALQTVTGKPQDALPNAIKSRLIGVLHDMKGTNSLVLKQQLDFTERSKKKIIDKFPDEWKGIRQTLESNPDMPSQDIRVISDDASFKALPSGTQFKDPSGQLHTKR